MMSHAQNTQATFCHCLKFSFNVLQNILIVLLLIKKSNRGSPDGFHIMRFGCPSGARLQVPQAHLLDVKLAVPAPEAP